jgi:uncharacterized protein (TIGR02246 family)
MNADEQAIRNLVASWHRATAAGDVDAVLALMADDVIFLVAVSHRCRRSALERAALLSTSHPFDRRDQEIVVPDNLAYCWTMLTVHIIPVAGGTETRAEATHCPFCSRRTLVVSVRGEPLSAAE